MKRPTNPTATPRTADDEILYNTFATSTVSMPHIDVVTKRGKQNDDMKLAVMAKILIGLLAITITMTIALHSFIAQTSNDEETMHGMHFTHPSRPDALMVPHQPTLDRTERRKSISDIHIPPKVALKHNSHIDNGNDHESKTAPKRKADDDDDDDDDDDEAKTSKILRKKRSKIAPRPDEMEGIGDKSTRYRELRAEYDALLPVSAVEERLKFVRSLRKRSYRQISDAKTSYDILDCPLFPPDNYPQAFPIMDVLNNWGPDDPSPHLEIYQGICVFDHDTEKDKALNYREAEKPFIIRDDPKVLRTVERWNQPGYMQKLMGRGPRETEYSENNHFMFWNARQAKTKTGKRKFPKDWKPPTEMIKMTFEDWLSKANVKDESKLGPDNPHWYFRTIACGTGMKCKKDEFLFDELPFFQPKESLFMVDTKQQHGIFCRFGMKGVIAENHFDATRNMVALFGGERRYMLAHPDQCENLALLPKGHPSGRHSAVDWSNPDLDNFPQFAAAEANEIVLQAGDVLYLPTYWFHYIISLDVNLQCNSRSGVTREHARVIKECGF